MTIMTPVTPRTIPVYLAATLVLGLITQVACSDSERVEPIGDLRYEIVAQLLPEPNPNLDILFVVDNSGSMFDEQESLARWANEYLFGVLQLELGALPNLHIGVISTNMGAGSTPIAGCQGSGDRGILQNQPRVADCTGPSDRYIRDVANPDGTRDRNYEGELAETFGCIAQLGVEGCGYEQPLKAMKRALDPNNTDNAGFLREDALLAVVFVTDEDDCSALDTAMFQPSAGGDDLNSPLGPMTSFRCFEFGVTCAETDPRAPGSRTECAASASPYMDDVGPYIEFLHDLKGNPSMVMVAGIFGDRGPVEVRLDTNSQFPQLAPKLAPSCVGTVGGGEANPAIRLDDFLAGFPGRSQFASICADELAGPLQSIASVVGGTAARSPCLLGEIADVDANTSGLQADCRVYRVTEPGGAGETHTLLEACDGTGEGDCYRIVQEAETCAHTPTRLAVAGPEADGDHLFVECRTPRTP